MGKDIKDRLATQGAEFDAVDRLAIEIKRLDATPIVDDDYPAVRHAYEGALAELLSAMHANGRFDQGNRYHLRHVSEEPVLDADARIGGTVFRRGVRWSTVVERAQREFNYHVSGDGLPAGGPLAADFLRAEPSPIKTVDQLRQALAGLVGATTREELQKMELAVRVLPAPESDKAVTINAIHALLASLPEQEAAHG